LLKIYEDESYADYLNDVSPLEFAKKLPFLQDDVLVIGYPEGKRYYKKKRMRGRIRFEN
jgi:hypothetical protein